MRHLHVLAPAGVLAFEIGAVRLATTRDHVPSVSRVDNGACS
jgi:hypothetical protein